MGILVSKEKKCLDPEFKLCQYCPLGWIQYGDDVETKADLDGAVFNSGCIYGLDKEQNNDRN